MAAKRRRSRGPATVFTLLLLAFALALAFLSQHWDALLPDPDAAKLRYEREIRRAQYKSGLKLRGIPDVKTLEARLDAANLKLGAPIFVRIFKREFLFEMWIKNGTKFQHFATYPICRYSGWLGPKLKQGDHQAPEGVYTVSAKQLNPNSRWHRSFNLGYPNKFDRSHDRTGNYLMVHGGCSSVGCYAMTNETIDEIWKLVTTALDNGQSRFQVQIFPFRMSKQALEERKDHRWAGFWQQLKSAYDIFETTRVPPLATVCNREYRFKPASKISDGSAPIDNSCTVATAD